MRVAFAGAGTFAVPILEALARTGVELLRVVTRSDRPAGRGRKVAATPVAGKAAELGLPLVKTGRIAGLRDELAGLDLDLLVVADYGEIVPPEILALPRLGPFNVHGSLLPRWRGASPCAWAIRIGDTVTGVTVFRMVKQMDAGPVLCQREVPILAEDTAGTLEDRLAREAAGMIGEQVARLESGPVTLREQDPDRVTLAPKLAKADGMINWSDEADALSRHVRAMQPWPGAYSFLVQEGKPARRIAILEARALPAGRPEHAPGAVTGLPGDAIEVACGNGVLAIRRLQLAGRKPLNCKEFLRGMPLREGNRFSEEEPPG
jgi:methionyl-tRNA formyltransferase